MQTRTRPGPLEVFWGLCAVLGLVAVGIAAARVDGADFLNDAFGTPAARTVTLDLLLLGVPVVVFMVVEAARLGMRRPWLWAVLAVPLPGAFLVPLFLCRRERLLRLRS